MFTVVSLNIERYSFKIEFDQYDSSISYHALDKLSLNNLIQDSTMMKDSAVLRRFILRKAAGLRFVYRQGSIFVLSYKNCLFAYFFIVRNAESEFQ